MRSGRSGVVDASADSRRKAGGDVERSILDAVRAIRLGSVEVVIHDSNVVQIVKVEKVRLEAGPSERGGN